VVSEARPPRVSARRHWAQPQRLAQERPGPTPAPLIESDARSRVGARMPYANYQRLAFDHPLPRVLRITFDRPERFNALDEIGHREITYVWHEVDADPDIDCVIVTGRGKAFSAGGDFEMIEKIRGDFATRARTWKEARDLVYNIIDCNKPIISAINGPAVGAG